MIGAGVSITVASSVEQVLTEFPATVMVFVRRRMHCVGCPLARFESIADACRIYRYPVNGVLAELRDAASTGLQGQERLA